MRLKALLGLSVLGVWNSVACDNYSARPDDPTVDIDPTPTPDADATPLADFEVDVVGLRSDDGQIMLIMFDKAHKAGWPDDSATAFINATLSPIENGELRYTFPNVPYDTYAIALLHDENNDEDPNMLLGIPTEGVGFSGGIEKVFSEPTFDDASFTIDASSVDPATNTYTEIISAFYLL